LEPLVFHEKISIVIEIEKARLVEETIQHPTEN